MPKIYTKTGDQGTTSLVDGQRVSKTHPRLEATGSVDELNATIGIVIAHSQQLPILFVAELHQIQNELFNFGSRLACEDQAALKKLPPLGDEHIQRLEKQIDEHTGQIPPLANFILPGGAAAAAFLHLSRTICRRAERESLKIQDDLDPILPKYLNRLSDYLFVLARAVNHHQKITEPLWKK